MQPDIPAPAQMVATPQPRTRRHWYWFAYATPGRAGREQLPHQLRGMAAFWRNKQVSGVDLHV